MSASFVDVVAIKFWIEAWFQAAILFLCPNHVGTFEFRFCVKRPTFSGSAGVGMTLKSHFVSPVCHIASDSAHLQLIDKIIERAGALNARRARRVGR